jgi:hypothetical protein
MCNNGQIKRSQRLPKNPTNGQIPAWSNALNSWQAVNNDSVSRDNPEVINGEWLFNAPVTYSGGSYDPFGVASPSSGFTTGADIDGNLFYKNSLGGIITFRTASITSEPIFDLPSETGTIALRGKTGIHFDSDANISALSQVLKDPANNSLPISVSTSLVLITSTLSVDNDIKIHNNLGYGIKSANDQRVMNIYNGLVTSTGTNWAIGHNSASARIHVRGDGTNPITRWEDSTGGLFWSLNSTATILRMGGISALFPAIKQNGIQVDFRLANDSGFAPIGISALSIAGYGFAQLSTRYYIDQDTRNVAFGANVSIKGGNIAADPTAILDVASTSKGILIPRLTTVQRDAIAAPAESLLIYNATTRQFNYWNSATWKTLLTD